MNYTNYRFDPPDPPEVDYPDVRPIGKMKIKTARTRKRCHACRSTIEPGQRYERQTYKNDDGKIKAAVTHAGTGCVDRREGGSK